MQWYAKKGFEMTPGKCFNCITNCYAPVIVFSQRGGGVGRRDTHGELDNFKKQDQIPHPWDNQICYLI